MDVALGQDGPSSQVDIQTDIETTQSTPATQQGERAIENAITELDKLEKFRFEGQEYTPKALKDAILRQQVFSKKTSELAKERESFEQERKFYDNLYADLNAVRQDPNLASEFIKLYPEKFHQALKQVLTESQGQASPAQTQKQSAPFDVELQGRLTKLEKHLHEQEVSKNTQEINSLISEYSKKFPKAIPKLAIADVFEAYNQGVKPSAEMWEQAFQASQEFMESQMKTHYGELQKKQTEANKKARDVDSGGGTPSRAPKKFGSLREVTEHAANSLENR